MASIPAMWRLAATAVVMHMHRFALAAALLMPFVIDCGLVASAMQTTSELLIAHSHIQTTENQKINQLKNDLFNSIKAESYNQAIDLVEEIMLLEEKMLGVDNPRRMFWIGIKGGIYTKQGRYNKAEKIFLNVLSFISEAKGSNHINTVDSRKKLAWL